MEIAAVISVVVTILSRLAAQPCGPDVRGIVPIGGQNISGVTEWDQTLPIVRGISQQPKLAHPAITDTESTLMNVRVPQCFGLLPPFNGGALPCLAKT